MIPTVCVLAAMNFGLMTQCQYVPMPDRRVALWTAEALVIGKLTPDGKFKTITQMPSRDGIVIYSGPDFTVLNTPYVIARPVVYDFDGKQLVPGRVTEHGAFIFDPKGKAIPFAEYEFSATAPPIWNLPGRFLPLGIDPDQWPASAWKGGGIANQPGKPGGTWAGFGNPGSWAPPASVGGGGGGQGGVRRTP